MVAAACGLALGAAVLGGITGGVVTARGYDGSPLDHGYRLVTPPRTVTDRPADSVAGVAALATPSVVMIKVGADGGRNQGTGSGFVIQGGYIVTNNHVVDLDGQTADTTLRVNFSDGMTVPARLVGRDPYSDIAVIKPLGAGVLPALTFGDSSTVAVGDPVIAIGSPLGLADTVTSGIVSALDRPVQPGTSLGIQPTAFFDAIQTDAPINPGNSGGPLLNSRGEVIGIDAAIDTIGGYPFAGVQSGSIGLGFAIPVNQARRVIVQLIRTGHATHSDLGVTLNQQFTGTGAQISLAESEGPPSIVPGGPAARAGLRPGDVITRLGSQTVASADALMDAVGSLPPGAAVQVTFVRHGAVRVARVTLGAAGE